MLASTVIRGSSVYEPAELFGAYREHLGKPVSATQVQAIAAAIAERYARDGYPRPQIRVDDDLIPLGVLRIDVHETRIGAVNISGDPGPHRPQLERLGARLQADDILRQKDLQWTLRQMRDLPGLTLSATTSRDAQGLSVYSLDIDTDFQPVTGVVRLTNRGTEEAGPNFALGQFVANGLFGGRTSLGVAFGAALDYEEYHGLGLIANRRIGDDGLRLATTAFRSRSNPHEAPADRDDRFLRDRLTLTATKPLAASPGRTLALSAALDLDDLVILRGSDPLRDERLRMLDLSMSRTWRPGGAVQYAAVANVVKGLGGLNSGLDSADLAVDPRSEDFALVRLTLTRAARINERWSWRVDGYAQHTADVLPYSQRFKIGGDRLGRGFEVPEIAGDQGLGAKTEVRRHLKDMPRLEGTLAAYSFYDIGATQKQDLPGRESAATAGVGMRIQGRHASGSFELAKPLTHGDVEGRRDLSVFAEFSYRL